MTRIPLSLAVGLFVAIALDTAVQLTWKAAAVRLADGLGVGGFATALVSDPIYAGLALLIAAQLVNWLRVLRLADVSFAQPITALSYISVCLLSAYWFGERLDAAQWLGIAAILVGVWLVSWTDHAPPQVKVVEP